MKIELINTGSELLLGRVLNRHQQWVCRQLTDRGYGVTRQTAVTDAAGEIAAVVAEALGRAELVITTGGLGPTSDDCTRSAVAGLLGLKLVEDRATLARLEAWAAERRRVMPAAVRVQALVPEGARVLANAHGTAPGLVMSTTLFSGVEGRERHLVMLPGPPRELQPMFLEQVLPWLADEHPAGSEHVMVTLRSVGVPESVMQERIEGPLAGQLAQGLEIGYCARPGEVDVRLSARGEGARALVAEAEAVVRGLVGRWVYGEGEDRLESVVLDLLRGRGETLALAESCTGGRIANRLTDVAGASAVFVGGVVAYSNALKERLLGVSGATLAQHGAVSEAVAREMAVGVRKRLETDFGLAVTGIAGPGGGTIEKPVGTVYLALAGRETVEVQGQLNRFEREVFKQMTSQQALEMLRRRLVGFESR